LKRSLYALTILLCLLSLAVCNGCRESTKPKASSAASHAAAAAQYRNDLLGYALDNLDQLEEFNSDNALGQLLQRFNPQFKPKQPIDPLVAAWPESEMFRQIVDRLNQWVRAQPKPADWKLDPMIASLPKSVLELPQIKNLDKMEFSTFDVFALQEDAWLRDITLWAKGDGIEDLDRARSLFDWTVRNIQLEQDRENRVAQFPRETLLFGRGTATERAWVFILLLRQLDIEAALLAVDDSPEAAKKDAPATKGPDASPPGKTSKTDKPAESKAADKSHKSLRPWCVGVLIEGNIYLFDPLRGLPIPAPNGVALDDKGQLVIRPATLQEVAKDPKLLRRMDCDESHPYPFKSVDPKRVSAMLEASPTYLGAAMWSLKPHLSGARKMVVTAAPDESAKNWKAANVGDVGLWGQPYATLYQREKSDWRASGFLLQNVIPLYMVYSEHVAGRTKAESKDPLEMENSQQSTAAKLISHPAPLLRGRVLSLKGKFTGDDGAVHYLQIARPSLQSLVTSSEPDDEKQAKVWAKENASYWLGLIAYQRGNFAAAIDYLQKRTIEDTPNGPWTSGARYNLARTYEADGKIRLATLLYTSDTSVPGYEGNILRAKWLEELAEKKKPEKD
jgi:hypothetical protein